jgi:hypothetical protein
MNEEIREFSSGANRDGDKDKLDIEGFISPIVMLRFCEYMHKNRHMRDGSLRDADNWQKLFGPDHYKVCIKSLSRHFLDLWLFHRGKNGREDIEEALCGIIFNAMAYLLKLLEDRGKNGYEK